MNKIEIPLSKKKTLLTVASSILFVGLGIYFITTIADQQARFNPTLVKGIGIASVCFSVRPEFMELRNYWTIMPG